MCAENSGKPVGGRGSALDPAGGISITALPIPLASAVAAPPVLSAFSLILGPGLIRQSPKQSSFPLQCLGVWTKR